MEPFLVLVLLLCFLWHLRFTFILVFVEVQSFGPQDEPAQLPVFHDTPLPPQPAGLQRLLLLQRRGGPGEPGQLSKNHALGSGCMDTQIEKIKAELNT